MGGRDKPGHDDLGMWNTRRRSPPATSCTEIFWAFSPVKGRSPPEMARFQRALDRAEGSENKAREEVDGLA